ncbi:16S rRNA (cytosine(1402)-N(4))-methyltransferase RsmH [Mycobacterium sp.]|uniref:16S rRNA (cytosine(1402)-N(4))-methyltransferase RsmH n=1 Tax=Mycobacterium sp. TaxID=1785 RepID=UPI002C062909|nr:16S rRNA (cytosine(1402)-N(4))-methyltransferase RsmH [Mycobacterium sp.]HKP44289.1 16S rRNA (cytosine(1402)-N(4))-methyltransferase RsmH [Mycobacterium sp.]
MKLCTTSSDSAADRHVARASWPLSEPALAYFPNARSALSDRDLGAGVHLIGGAAMPGHIPVLLDRCVELLTPALTRHSPDGEGAVLIDATLGAGGHAERFLTEFSALRLIGLDRDPDALWIAGERLAQFGDRVMLVRTRYDGIEAVLAQTGDWAGQVDGVLFDLGVSSMQLDRTERGFSYAADAPLDMRMDPDATLTAAEVINTYDEKTLARVLREFGEERFAGRIAAHIVRRRGRRPFATTGELVELLYEAIPAPARRTGGHPAKRTFQALRIVVNGELDSLRDALPAALGALAPGGRIVVMAYQSLEDRIVKSQFAAVKASRTPPGLPVELPGHEPDFVALTRGAERAGPEEIAVNPRSASVRLRALEKVGGQR